MSRISKINKHAKHRRAQFHARKRKEELRRMEGPIARSEKNLTPKRVAAHRTRERTQ